MTPDFTYSDNTSNVSNLEVYKKALSVFKLSRALATFISNNKSVLAMHTSTSNLDKYSLELVMDSMSLAPNIASAQVTNNKRLKKSSLVSLRRTHIKLNAYCDYLERNYNQAKEYINVLRKELQAFTKEHSQWERTLKL